LSYTLVRVFVNLKTVDESVVGVALTLTFPESISASKVARDAPVLIVPNSFKYTLVPSCNTFNVVT
jgi:hypothetical protein